jgi:cytochrome c-type biogenesis protein CcmH
MLNIQTPPMPLPSPGERVNRLLNLCRLMFIFGVIFFSMSATLHAADLPFEFKTPEQEQRYKDLTEQLRCLVCQNQSLADSHADLAQDLRNEVYQMIIQGQSNQQIIDYLVARYGDFVLFKPPLQADTVLLWTGPFLMLLGALLIVFRYTQKNRKQVSPEELNSDDQQKLDVLLQGPEDKGKG